MGILVGNIASSIVLHAFSTHAQTMDSVGSSASRNVTSVTSKNMSVYLCGIRNCDCSKRQSCDLLYNQYREDLAQSVDKLALYTLTGAFVTMEFIAAIIMWCSVVESTKPTTESMDDARQSLIGPDQQNSSSNANSVEAESTTKEFIRNAVAVAKFYVVQPAAILLAPLALNNGLVLGLVLAQVTRDWISCTVGKI